MKHHVGGERTNDEEPFGFGAGLALDALDIRTYERLFLAIDLFDDPIGHVLGDRVLACRVLRLDGMNYKGKSMHS